MKRARVAAGIGAALAAVVFALPWLVQAERFRPVIQSRLEAALGRPVEIGRLSFHVIPLSLRATGLDIKGLATVEKLAVHVRFLPLLQGDIEVESLVLTRPVVTYKADSASKSSNAPPKFKSLRIIDGRLITGGGEYANIDAEIQTKGAEAAGTVSWENGTLPIKLEFAATNQTGVWQVAKLDAAMGKVTAAFTGKIDTNAGTVHGALQIKPSPLAGMPIKSDYKPTGMLTADVKVSGPFQEPALTGSVQIANLEVTGGKLSQTLRASALHLELTPGQIVAKPFSLQVGPTLVEAAFLLKDLKSIDATISTKDASIRDLLAMAQRDEVTGTGAATLQVRATGLLAKPQLTGSGSISNADLHVAALQPNLKIDSARIRFEADSATIDNAVLHVGKTTAKGSATVHNFAQPQWAIVMSADQLSNVEVQSWIPAGKGGESKPIAVTGELAVGRLSLNDLTLESVKATMALRGKVLTLDPLSANVYGGRVAGSATVDMRTQPAVFSLKTHLDKIESEQLLNATTPLRKVISGLLTADAQLQFSPKPGEEIARTMDGTVQFSIVQGKLIAVNLMGEMGALARFLKPPNSTASASNLGMKGKFNLKNGVAETSDLRLELDRAAAMMTGTMNLVDQSLDLRMLTTFNKQLSDEVGGTQIGGFLSAALASPKGELMMPSLVRGTFTKPVFTPDAVTIGKMKLNSPGGIQESVQGLMDLFKQKKKAP